MPFENTGYRVQLREPPRNTRFVFGLTWYTVGVTLTLLDDLCHHPTFIPWFCSL